MGETKVENDDQVMVVYFVDMDARDRVTRAMHDAAALAREHEIPHRPARPESELRPITPTEDHGPF